MLLSEVQSNFILYGYFIGIIYFIHQYVYFFPSDKIRSLSHLNYLFINNNYINDLPELIEKLRLLNRIFISENHLTGLPQAMEKLTQLFLISLACNDFQKFPDILFFLPKLKSLFLSERELNLISSENREKIIIGRQRNNSSDKRKKSKVLLINGHEEPIISSNIRFELLFVLRNN